LVAAQPARAAPIAPARLGGYVRTVRRPHPDASVPPVYRADGLLADARELRARLGDEKFIADLPNPRGATASSGWGNTPWAAHSWTSEKLDEAFNVPAGTTDPEQDRKSTRLNSS